MKAFDPFTASLEDARAQPDADMFPRGAVLRWGAAQMLLKQRDQYEASPIHGVAWCVRFGLVAPDWLANPFCGQWDKVESFQVGSYDEAFGRAVPKGKHLSKLRLKQMVWASVLANTRNGKLDRKAVKAECGLSEKQALTMLPKTRPYVRGYKPHRGAVKANHPAHDPFGILATDPAEN